MNLRERPRILKPVALCLLTLVFGTSACSVKKRESAVLRVALGSDPPTLDPATADTGVAIFALQDVVSTLFTYDPQDRIVNFDAQSHAWENEGRLFRVQLRSDLKWSDGKVLSPCDYRDAWRRVLDPDTPATMADVLFDIRGAREVKSGRAKPETLGVRCDEAKNSIEIDVDPPYSPRLPHALTFIVSAPVRMDRVKEQGGGWMLPSAGKPGMASGSFVIERWRRDQDLDLRARKADEGASADRIPRLAKIHFPIVRDPTTALTLYETGGLDILLEIPPVLLPKLGGRKDLVTSPFYTTYMIGFSLTANPVLKDARVRRALALAYDSAEVPKILQGGEMEAKGWTPPGLLPESARPTQSIRNLEAARALLNSLGYGPKKKFPKLTLAYNTGERHRLLMERAAHRWKEDLGIDVELRPTEWKALVAELKRKTPDLYRYAWAAAYSDPLFFLELYRSDGLNNFGKWKNAEYDAIVARLSKVRLEDRDEKFWRDYARAQDILVREDPALIPVYHYVRNTLVAEQVKNLKLTGRGVESLRDVELR